MGNLIGLSFKKIILISLFAILSGVISAADTVDVKSAVVIEIDKNGTSTLFDGSEFKDYIFAQALSALPENKRDSFAKDVVEAMKTEVYKNVTDNRYDRVRYNCVKLNCSDAYIMSFAKRTVSEKDYLVANTEFPYGMGFTNSDQFVFSRMAGDNDERQIVSRFFRFENNVEFWETDNPRKHRVGVVTINIYIHPSCEVIEHNADVFSAQPNILQRFVGHFKVKNKPKEYSWKWEFTGDQDPTKSKEMIFKFKCGK